MPGLEMMISPVKDAYPGLSIPNCRTFLPLRKGPPHVWSQRPGTADANAQDGLAATRIENPLDLDFTIGTAMDANGHNVVL
jgi:hypothetical protein